MRPRLPSANLTGPRFEGTLWCCPCVFLYLLTFSGTRNSFLSFPSFLVVLCGAFSRMALVSPSPLCATSLFAPPTNLLSRPSPALRDDCCVCARLFCRCARHRGPSLPSAAAASVLLLSLCKCMLYLGCGRTGIQNAGPLLCPPFPPCPPLLPPPRLPVRPPFPFLRARCAAPVASCRVCSLPRRLPVASGGCCLSRDCPANFDSLHAVYCPVHRRFSSIACPPCLSLLVWSGAFVPSSMHLS